MKAIVIGAGIGGLTAANALLRVGCEVEVYERAPELREVGAGIGLWGNAVGALKSLGLDGAVLARGEKMQIAEFLLSSGRRLVSTPAEQVEKAGGSVIALVHRAELLEELARPLPAGCIRLGRTFVRYESVSCDGVVRAHFVDGAVADADILVGADGLHSRARAQLVGDRPPRYAGYTAYRSVVQVDDRGMVPAGYVSEVWGARGARFGITRVGGGRVYWWASLNAPPTPGAEGVLDETARRRLLQTHGGFCRPVPQLIEATDPGRIIRNDVFDRPPTRRWTDGRVVLMGDAAHPTTPNLGQGGCMAMEDGVILARMLAGARASDTPEIERRLCAFNRRRRPKTAAIVRASRWFGALGHWENPALCWGRDLVMGLTARGAFVRLSRRIGRFDA